jgi:hypothetical protein
MNGVPVYLSGPQYPGGRILNFDAFQQAAANAQGDLPRNFARDFGAVQRTLPFVGTFHLAKGFTSSSALRHLTFQSSQFQQHRQQFK